MVRHDRKDALQPGGGSVDGSGSAAANAGAITNAGAANAIIYAERSGAIANADARVAVVEVRGTLATDLC